MGGVEGAAGVEGEVVPAAGAGAVGGDGAGCVVDEEPEVARGGGAPEIEEGGGG